MSGDAYLLQKMMQSITMMSYGAWWHLKSPASGLFTQPFIQAQIKKKTSKLRVTGLCAVNSPVTGEFPAQRASNAENLSICWCHHAFDHIMPCCLLALSPYLNQCWCLIAKWAVCNNLMWNFNWNTTFSFKKMQFKKYIIFKNSSTLSPAQNCSITASLVYWYDFYSFSPRIPDIITLPLVLENFDTT